MSRFKNKITNVLKLQPLKPCHLLSDDEILEEEVRSRGELGRLVASLSLHIGTCAAHGALSAGATLPLHLPVVVWIAYSLTKCARRHQALRIEFRQNRPHLKKKNMRNKRIAASLVLGLISPILAALGADIISEIVSVLAGQEQLLSIGASGISGPGASNGSPDFEIVTSQTGIFSINDSSQFDITKEVRRLA